VHIPVLAGPALEWLRIREDGVYVDCTVGGGGHAERIAARLRGGRLIALDRDPQAVEAARARLAPFEDVIVLHRNYADLSEVLSELHISEVDGVLFDLGVSSMQLDDAARGFSFQEEGPLDMRMDPTQPRTAAEWLGHMQPEELARELREYGDVQPARRVAKSLLRWRDAGRLRSTLDLAGAVREGVGSARGAGDEVRKVFQAVRIAVNDELSALRNGLSHALTALAPGGRLVSISFHSGEDRIVKNVLRDASRPRRHLFPDGRTRSVEPAQMKVLTPRPIQPDQEEVRLNSRAHSARLRAAEHVPVTDESAS
jgi:16S rRNA (cytosine1402-N4)-methyltransferase